MANLLDHIIADYAFPKTLQADFYLETTENSLEQFESWLKREKNISKKCQKRLMYVFIEMLQNINKHSCNSKNIHIAVQKTKENRAKIYHLYCLNEIDKLNKTRITNEFSIIEKLNPTEIKQNINQRIKTNGEGTGLLSIKQKSDKGPVHHIIRYQSKLYLLIKTEIYD
ncbi:MAG: DUF6272 family protein [Bacteroidota bacterium]|nr:DUF6272 family protein [Bacteroidota bacterium]